MSHCMPTHTDQPEVVPLPCISKIIAIAAAGEASSVKVNLIYLPVLAVSAVLVHHSLSMLLHACLAD